MDTTSVTSSGLWELNPCGTSPEAVEVVEASSIFGEHVHNEVKAVEQNPFAMVVPFHMGRSGTMLSELLDDFIDDCPCLTPSLPGADHKVIGECA